MHTTKSFKPYHFVKYKKNLQCTAPSALNDVLMNMTEALQTAVTEEIKKMEHVMQKKFIF